MQAVTVSALVNFLREVLEANEVFSDLWVEGEVSNYSRPSSGHRYLTLKDARGAIRAVLFRDTQPGMTLRDGQKVLVHGRVSVYPQRGELQFICDFVRDAGVGILAARFEQLRERLEAEGLFAPERKRPVPAFPHRIGVVTSPTGAALQDIRDVLSRRWPLAELVVAPAAVQGEQAAGQIVAALRALAREPGLDVAILARGGGASEDLSAFNDERVARAIYGFPVPLVAGVGHETDITIADMVADLRAPTPSAAAERATPSAAEFLRGIAILERTMASCARGASGGAGASVAALAARMDRRAPDMHAARQQVAALERTIEAGLGRSTAASRARYEHGITRLATLNPMATLERGYAIVQQAKTGKVVTSVRRVKPGTRISVSVKDGAFWGEIS